MRAQTAAIGTKPSSPANTDAATIAGGRTHGPTPTGHGRASSPGPDCTTCTFTTSVTASRPARWRSGETLPVIGKLLGHGDIEPTARYAHLAQDSIHETAERIAEALLLKSC